MLKSKNAADDWAAWHNERENKRRELSATERALAEAKSDSASARQSLLFHIQQGNRLASRPIDEVAPTTDDIQALLGRLKHTASPHPKTQESVDAHEHLEGIRQAQARLQQAEAAIEAAIDKRDTLASNLEKIQGRMPKATQAALDTIRKSREQAQTYRDEIADMVARLERDDGSLTAAVEAATAAQEKVEELEALTSIGYGDEAEARAAASQQAKARTQAEKAQTEARRQQALKRGLQRKLAEANDELAHLQAAYSAAAAQVHGEKLANLEARLVEHLTGKAITDLLAEMAEHRTALEQAEPGTAYQPARVQVSLPHLYFHPDRAELSGEHRTVQTI